MILLRIAAAALALAAIPAAPAFAQTSAVAEVQLPDEVVDAVAKAAIASIGTSDTVILVYVETEQQPGKTGFRMGIRYVPPGKDFVRIHAENIGGMFPPLRDAVIFGVTRDRESAVFVFVIDHGKARAAVRHFNPAGKYGDRIEAETALVFPGAQVEPYVPRPGDRPAD